MRTVFHSRLNVLIGMVLALGTLLAAWCVKLQVIQSEELRQRADTIRTRHRLVPPRRGPIYARDGETVLAEDRPLWEVTLNYWYFTEPSHALQRLAWLGDRDGLTDTERATLLPVLGELAHRRDPRVNPSRIERFFNTWDVRHRHPLVRREIDLAVGRLGALLGADSYALRARLDRVEAEIDRVIGGEGRRGDQYVAITRLGSSPVYWDDLARAERRDASIPEAARRFQDNPLRLACDVPRSVVETLVELDVLFPGVEVEPGARRHYPQGDLAAHVLGYMRETERIGFTPPEGIEPLVRNSPVVKRLLDQAAGDLGEELVTHYYGGEEDFRDMFRRTIYRTPIGVTGIERSLDDRLFGDFGILIEEKDVRNRRQDILADYPPVAGVALTLTLDVAAQAEAERALREVFETTGCPGAAVAIDTETGEVLVCASCPGYDLNRLMGATEADFAYQRQYVFNPETEGSPQFNRATMGAVPPGSVFKILTAIAACEEDILHGPDYDQAEFCDGKWSMAEEWGMGGYTCHGGTGCGCRHTLASALEHSCNVYFHDIGHRVGYAALRDWATRFGFGEHTGIEIGEPLCWVPGRDGSRVNRLFPMGAASIGEPALISIGQGRLRTTPMQVARFMATIANRGRMPTPHLCRLPETEYPFTTVVVSPATWDQIHEGLRRVIESPGGTAHSLRTLRKWHASGKTGTAQTGRQSETTGRDLHYSWFAGYAPREAPAIAFAVYIENTEKYGGNIAGPVCERILDVIAQSPEYARHFTAVTGNH